MKLQLFFLGISLLVGCGVSSVPVTAQQVPTTSTEKKLEESPLPMTKKERLDAVIAGKYAPVGTVYQTDSTSISTARFKGKYIVLDFWATWCGPCVKEGPIFQELGKHYADKNVEFVGISVDRDFQRWQQFLKNRQWEGQQYWMGMNETTPFFGFAYSEVEIDPGQLGIIVGLPKYVMLDPEGKILHNSSFIKPSNPKFKELLEGFLK